MMTPTMTQMLNRRRARAADEPELEDAEIIACKILTLCQHDKASTVRAAIALLDRALAEANLEPGDRLRYLRYRRRR